MAPALDELHGLGYDHFSREEALFESVTLNDIKSAAEKYLKPEAHVVTVLTGENQM
jgi:predicted Zn-dependent peptidase